MTVLYAGVDLGGTAVKAIVSQGDGGILAQDSVPTQSHEGPDRVLDRITALVNDLCADAGGKSCDLAGVGMGVPGLVDIESGTTKFLPNMPTQWRDISVGKILSDRLHCPVRLMNDARTATLGELRFGHGCDQKQVTMVFFSLGTGVGGGVVIDGRLRLGPIGAAGEIGHQTLLPNGPQCGCGNRGCLETLASGPALSAEGIRLMQSGMAPNLHELVAGDTSKVTTQTMAIAAESDKKVHDAILIAAEFVGIAAANIVSALHPDMIVLGGGVAQLGSLLTDTVSDVIGQRVGMFPTDNVQVLTSRLGKQAGVMGAVALAIDFASGRN